MSMYSMLLSDSIDSKLSTVCCTNSLNASISYIVTTWPADIVVPLQGVVMNLYKYDS